MANRKLYVEQPNGQPLFPPCQLDLSDIPNADASAPLVVVIKEQCDYCEQWHEAGQIPLPNWSDDNYKAYLERAEQYRDRKSHA